MSNLIVSGSVMVLSFLLLCVAVADCTLKLQLLR